MTRTGKSFLTVALCLTVVMGVAGCAMAHGCGGYGGYGWHRGEHSGYAYSGDYYARGDRNGWADDSRDVRARERRNFNSRDAVVDYVAPHKKNSNCEGMTGPHGRHID